MTEVHSCSYFCERPECIKAQRDELRERLAQRAADEEAIYETIIQWDEGGGKRSRRELARRILALYTALRERLAREDALDRMAESARELGLTYEPLMEDLRVQQELQESAADIVRVSKQAEFITYHGDDEGWSDWVCPDPKSYLMKCCDCGLVHEAQFGVVRYKSETEREYCDMVDDPNLQAVFRMRRSEQWSPKDTAHRAGGLSMEQPAQQPPKFPTMLRKMWSGAEVQKWINENWEQA